MSQTVNVTPSDMRTIFESIRFCSHFLLVLGAFTLKVISFKIVPIQPMCGCLWEA